MNARLRANEAACELREEQKRERWIDALGDTSCELSDFETSYKLSNVPSEERDYKSKKFAIDGQMIGGDFKKSRKKKFALEEGMDELQGNVEKLKYLRRQIKLSVEMNKAVEAMVDELLKKIESDEKCNSPLRVPSNDETVINRGLQIVKKAIKKLQDLATGNHISLSPGPCEIDICYNNELHENCTDANARRQVNIVHFLCTDGELKTCGEYNRSLCLATNSEIGINVSFHTSEHYADENVESFIKQLDANVKSQVDYLDFEGLEEEVIRVGRNNEIPLSLVPISKKIKMTYGDITKDSSQSHYAALPSYVLFCAAIKEMDDLKLEQVNKYKMLLWRDAINSALNVQFKVDFAKEHLKRIARAYFGLKAKDGKSKEEFRNVDGKVKKTEDNEEQNSEEKEEQQNSKVRLQCLREAEYFQGKPLSTGLLC